MEKNKQQIIKLFKNNVLGKKYEKKETKHCGSEGHWLEKQMEIKHNSKNAPDIYGYEMKIKTSTKTTFGDWCPDINKHGDKIKNKWWNNDNSKIKFMKKYGKYNIKKKRWSWAIPVKCCSYNCLGQKLLINEIGIFIVYNSKKDTNIDNRKNNNTNVTIKKILFGWSHCELKIKVENKFGIKGYFKPIKNKDDVYIGMQFGNPIFYDEFIENIKNNCIFLDSGTYMGNSRPYMQWRAMNKWFIKREKNNTDELYIFDICSNKLKVLDLFCGCGGLSHGLSESGLDVIAGIDSWQTAIDTYQKNNKHIALCKDLTTYEPSEFAEQTNISDIDIIVGGPPCQGFSIAGNRDTKDPRNSLFIEFVKYLDFFKPKAFVMENVVGILSMKNKKGVFVKDIIMEKLSENYNCKFYKLSAADFEVPQIRKRVLFIGFRKDLLIEPTEPQIASVHIPIKTILMPKKEIDAKYYLSKKAIDGINKRKKLMKEKGYGFGAKFVDLNKPSPTIPSRYYKDGYDALVRYSDEKIRRLTPKELMRIQTFSDNYEFCGTNKDIIMQIGNAVACKFAYHIGNYLIQKLIH
jgi:DNA-cytosine methyltransferase